jgi:hypothetical protein
MEPSWSPVVATVGNRSQNQASRKTGQIGQNRCPRLRRLPMAAHGKKGVDGSSPSEGSAKAVQSGPFSMCSVGAGARGAGYGAVYGAFASRRRPQWQHPVEMTELPLSELLAKSLVDPEAHLDWRQVARYESELEQAPPVVVFETEAGLLLADGYHRVAAAQARARHDQGRCAAGYTAGRLTLLGRGRRSTTRHPSRASSFSNAALQQTTLKLSVPQASSGTGSPRASAVRPLLR